MMEKPHSEAVSKASHPIKIDSVEPILIKPNTRGYAFLIVRIRTDQGIDGIGECHASGGGAVIGDSRLCGFYVRRT